MSYFPHEVGSNVLALSLTRVFHKEVNGVVQVISTLDIKKKKGKLRMSVCVDFIHFGLSSLLFFNALVLLGMIIQRTSNFTDPGCILHLLCFLSP